MSLDWHISKIKDYNQTCFVTEGEDIKLAGLTRTLIYATMAVGIPMITEENAGQFYARLHTYERVNGPYRHVLDNGKAECGCFKNELVDLFINPEDVWKHVGLKTNAARLSDSKFADEILRLLHNDAKDEWDKFVATQRVDPAGTSGTIQLPPDAKDSVPQG